MENTLFEPIFLNIEYFFYQIFVLGSRIFSGEIFSFFDFFIWLIGIISVILFFVLFYSILRIREIRQEQKEQLKSFKTPELKEDVKNPRWDYVLKQIESESPSDWKLAIIEADSMLDAMIQAMGYEGENLGDRMKKIEKSDFLTLDSAWEAHKIRNRIAHDGSDFVLDKRQTKRVIDLYKQVFMEFGFI